MQSRKKKSDEKYRILNGNAVLLILYLLHYPDYAYSMGVTFDTMREKTKQIPAALARHSNVQPKLRQLEMLGLLKKEKMTNKDKSWLDKFVYHVNLGYIDPSLDHSVASSFKCSPWLIYTDIFNKVIDKEEFIRLIISFKKYDYLTMLLYIRDSMYCFKHILLFYLLSVEAKDIFELIDESNFLGKLLGKNTVGNMNDFYELLKKDLFPLEINSKFGAILSKIIDYVMKNGLPSALIAQEKSNEFDLIQAQINEISNSIIPFLDELILKESKKERGFLN